MLENILQMVREYGETEVVNNPAVPNEHNNAVMSEASLAVAGTLQQALANGNMQDLMGLFQQGQEPDVMANPLGQQMNSGFIESITSKLGIDSKTATGIASSLIPLVISTLVKRTNSDAPEDSGFNISSLIGSLTNGGQGGGGLDIGGIISQFTGGGQGQQGGGGFDLNDIIEKVSGGAKQQQGGGGLADMIQGFFGK